MTSPLFDLAIIDVNIGREKFKYQRIRYILETIPEGANQLDNANTIYSTTDPV